MQVVLLRFLETGEIQRIGADRSHVRVNVRLITATNRDLPKRDRRRQLPRGSVLPPQRHPHAHPAAARAREDIPLLFEHYLDLVLRSAPRAAPPDRRPRRWSALTAYRWPGNIRELRNVAERLVLKTPASVLRRHGPARRARPRRGSIASDPAPAGAGAAARPQARPQVDELIGSHADGTANRSGRRSTRSFMSRDLTRDDLRAIIEIGLEHDQRSTIGSLVGAVQHGANEDYKRFLGFLRKHDCHLPFQRFAPCLCGGPSLSLERSRRRRRPAPAGPCAQFGRGASKAARSW